MEPITVTKSEFAQYCDIQETGAYNMLDPRARELTTLSKGQWIFVLKNYSDLKNKYAD